MTMMTTTMGKSWLKGNTEHCDCELCEEEAVLLVLDYYYKF
jgi:hypothetical protein